MCSLPSNCISITFVLLCTLQCFVFRNVFANIQHEKSYLVQNQLIAYAPFSMLPFGRSLSNVTSILASSEPAHPSHHTRSRMGSTALSLLSNYSRLQQQLQQQTLQLLQEKKQKEQQQKKNTIDSSKQMMQQQQPQHKTNRISNVDSTSLIQTSNDIHRNRKRIDLHIGALFPMTGSSGWLGGQGCQPAIHMALKDVNSAHDLLSGYRLVLHYNDSKCDPGLGATVLYDLIYEPPIKLLILGGCSIVCSTIAETAKMYNLIVLGYGSSSPALSNRERFPTFFRTHPSATIHNPTRIKLFEKFGWKKIAIILEAEEVFISTGKDLEQQCKKAGIEIITRVSFLTDPQDAVKSLARQDARIIIGMFYGGAARKVMCEAYKQNLFGKQHVWFLIGWYEDNWYLPVPEVNCTESQMLQVVEGHLTTEALMLNRDERTTIAGVTANKWQEMYEQELSKSIEHYDVNHKPEGYLEAPLAYDAIWAIALALNRTLPVLKRQGIQIESFNYRNGTVIRDAIKDALKDTQFLGVSGLVAFSERGDRIALTQVEQMNDGKYNLLGYYDTQTDNLTWLSQEKWIGGKPPPDHTIIVKQLIVVSKSFFITLNVISVIGVIWALGLLVFNFKFKNFRYIQMSHPVTNNIMLIGFIVCLSSIALFGLDGQKINVRYFSGICHARALFLSIGFSLSFGAMFTKIWISYRISTHMEHHGKHKKVKDREVYLTIGLFCLVDLCILAAWYFHSPMERRLDTFDLIDPDYTDEDIRIQPQLEHCDANLFWYGLLYGFKGLLLIFGLFLAYETRSVKLKQINDSRLIGMSIYNVVILCMITGPVSLVITNQVNGHFAFIAFTIICCCFLTMALVFTPKIVELVRRRGAHMAFGGSHLNGTFHETLTIQEQQEKFQKLTQENEELHSKISEKEVQIEEVRKQIEEITRRRRQQRIDLQTKGAKKAVRIYEPDSSNTSPSKSKFDDNNNRNQNSKIESSTTESGSEGVTLDTSTKTSDPISDETCGLQMIEEDESDFVRIESIQESTSLDDHKTNTKTTSDLEPSESYL